MGNEITATLKFIQKNHLVLPSIQGSNILVLQRQNLLRLAEKTLLYSKRQKAQKVQKAQKLSNQVEKHRVSLKDINIP